MTHLLLYCIIRLLTLFLTTAFCGCTIDLLKDFLISRWKLQFDLGITPGLLEKVVSVHNST